MERLNYHAYLAVQQSYSVAACLPMGAGEWLCDCGFSEEVPVFPLFRFLAACQWKTAKLAIGFKPEVVYSGSGLTAPATLMAAKLVGARSICFLHGLDIVADHPIYRTFFLPAIRRIDRILVNSHHTASLARALGIPDSRIRIVHPGCELPDWDQRDSIRLSYRAALHLAPQRPVLLAAGRLTARKGLAEFIRYSMPNIIGACPDLVLLIIGSEPENALKHKHGVLNAIRSAISETGLESCVRLLGSVNDIELSHAYFSADAMVFPVLDLPGDVEGFGMVAVEAAAHGLPTIGYSVGGVSDAVAQGRSGCLLPSGDYDALSQRIIDVMGAKVRLSSRYCREHAEQFSWQMFETKLLSVIDDEQEHR